MAALARSYGFELQLEASPEALWPLVADTNRFNAETGLPQIREESAGPLLRSGRVRFGLSVLGRDIPYEEEPFEWVRPERFAVLRRYRAGPIEEFRARLELSRRPAGGTTLRYEYTMRPRGLIGRLAVPALGRMARHRMTDTFRRYGRLALDEVVSANLPRVAGPLAAGGRERLALLAGELEEQGFSTEVVGRLVHLIEAGDDLTLSRLRPYALADAWHADRRSVLELFLHATRAGLVDLRWEVLCPLCRGAKESTETLSDLERHVRCEACLVEFDATLERSVELTFRPNPAVRRVEQYDYCVGGPQVTPHVVAQQLLSPRERRSVQLSLEPGRYRIRAVGIEGAQHLVVVSSGAAELLVELEKAGWSQTELELAPISSLTLVSGSSEERLFVVERTAWSDQAATGAEVIALQVFRDLFAGEVLRAGEEMSVGSQTIVFTDLRDSTQLYREIGDAPAFGSVADHFAVLRAEIQREDGAVVKTIGDAVMAVFGRPISALRALLEAQARLGSPQPPARPLVLKAGIHLGPCIAATLNGRLDYFGSIVNIAARIEGFSSGADVILSNAVRLDPEVDAMLTMSHDLLVEPLEATLRGFDEERFALWRVSRVD